MRLHIEEKDRMHMSLDGKMVGLRGISSMTVTSGGGVRGDPQCALGAGPQVGLGVVQLFPLLLQPKAVHFSFRFLYHMD